MGADALLAPLMSALSVLAPPYGPIIGAALLGIYVFWKTMRAFRREDNDDETKRWDRIGAHEARVRTDLEGELGRTREARDKFEAELADVEEKLRAEKWSAYLLRHADAEQIADLRRRVTQLRHDQRELRAMVDALTRKMGETPRTWPPDDMEAMP